MNDLLGMCFSYPNVNFSGVFVEEKHVLDEHKSSLCEKLVSDYFI